LKGKNRRATRGEKAKEGKGRQRKAKKGKGRQRKAKEEQVAC